MTRTEPFTRIRVAEHVLPGHPDKLADAIADAIVQEAFRRERRAAVAIEVAVNRDVVFVDGRIACRGARDLDIEAIVRGTCASAGFGAAWAPDPAGLRIIKDLDLCALSAREARIRAQSEDQAIVTGHATTRNAAWLPPEHLLSWRLARALWMLREQQPSLGLGPDGKVLVTLEEDAATGAARLRRLSLSLQCRGEDVARRAIVAQVCGRVIAETLGGDAAGPDWRRTPLAINDAGDFSVGGPLGDNGLTGKKLVADAYGPRVPIGGGAMSGKDLYKVDRAGAVLARRAALRACRRHGLGETIVTLAIQPGERCFQVIDAVTPDGRALPEAAREDLAASALTLGGFADAVPQDIDLVALARWGHFTPHAEAERLVEGEAAVQAS